MENGETRWRSLSVGLEITDSALDPAALGERLGTEIDTLSATGDDLGEIFDELLPKVLPLASELTTLRAEGCTIRLGIRGRVESGARLTVPPGVLAQAAALGLPLSFTTHATVSTETEDFLSSLGGPPEPHAD